MLALTIYRVLMTVKYTFSAGKDSRIPLLPLDELLAIMDT